MKDSFTVVEDGFAEFTVQRSRFIARASHVNDEAEAQDILRLVKKEYFDARHSPSAWVIGANGGRQKSSDDGEPGGTAGMPILDVIKKRGLTETIVVVTRYFGGIKLGAGGLVRAYSHAAALGIDAAAVARRVQLQRLSVETGYELYGALERFARQKGIRMEEPIFSDVVRVKFLAEPSEYDELLAAITNISAGRARITDDGAAEVLERIKS